MPRLYITKWVLARGIIEAEGEITAPPTPRGYIDRVWLKLPGMRYAQVLLIDREVFRTLREARADAKVRFEAALRSAQNQLDYLKAASDRLDKLTVHRSVKSLGRCRAFKDLQVQSGGPWIVDPQRLDREKTTGLY